MVTQDGLKDELKEIKTRVDTLRGIFDVTSLLERLEALQKKLLAKDLWESPAQAQELLKEKSSIENALQPFTSIEKRIEDMNILLELSEEEEGEVFLEDARKGIEKLKSELDDIELKSLLSLEEDKNNAIMIIHPGAGGIESQDWAQILMRMYIRWAERKGFKVEIVELLSGEEAGIKSATLTIAGAYAYGYLKGEAGVHRLVRISPFDAKKRRHTSFAAVLIYPEIGKDIEVELKEDDLKIDTFRASGAGGQHVNKTSSAVRITHTPTGIVVVCQNERSQFKNKATALKILRARLYAIRKKEQNKKLEEFIGEKKDIAWGSQIRSYVMQPYQLVKDHRTGIEAGNVDAVLDGSIDNFIKEYLLMKKEKATDKAQEK
ncbi:MAG: peptide chain release factor 2 [Thermodesulfovibrionia bacterium]|nr:peptide chain release factor 2 [Thermodesulfovibrionia bacterium]